MISFSDLRNREGTSIDKYLLLGNRMASSVLAKTYNIPYDLQYFVDIHEFFSNIESLIMAGEL